MARWLVLLAVLGLARAARADAPSEAPPEVPDHRPWSLDLTIHDFGLGLGNAKHIDGLRLNFRDSAPYTVHGISVTIWGPEHDTLGGDVTGLALGGLGIGAGGNVVGIAIAGLGIGAGGSVRGLAIGGLGVGAGDSIKGVAIGGLGVGSPWIEGVVAGLGVGGEDVRGLVIAPAYFHVPDDGRLTGVSISGFNRILGEQHGLVIGIINYAGSLHGVQLGLINYAGNNRGGLKLLPIANAHFD